MSGAPPSLEHVTTFQLVPTEAIDLGRAPTGRRRVGFVKSGSFDGPRLKGTVVGGDDHYLIRADKVFDLDVRMVLKTEDDAHLTITWRALISGPLEVLRQLGQDPPPAADTYYLRSAAFLESGDDRYAWVNQAVFVGSGQIGPVATGENGVVYQLYRVT